VLARGDAGPVVIMVEGKCAESFGPTVGKWLEKKGNGRKRRLRFLQETLGIPRVKAGIRYQLLHRATSALLTGAQYRAAAAVLIVHSYDAPKDRTQPAGWEDYLVFADLLGVQAESGKVQKSRAETAVPLFLLWMPGDLQYTKC